MLTATVLVLVRWWLVWQDEDGLEVQCVSWSAESAYSVSLRDLSRPLGLRKDTVPSCSDTKQERRDRKQRKGRRSEGASSAGRRSHPPKTVEMGNSASKAAAKVKPTPAAMTMPSARPLPKGGVGQSAGQSQISPSSARHGDAQLMRRLLQLFDQTGKTLRSCRTSTTSASSTSRDLQPCSVP
jgi:hypothetical protein